MPLLDGFGVIEAIGAEHMPATLFVTAFDAHAVKAFEVHAIDYLLKPFDRERFKRALITCYLKASIARPLLTLTSYAICSHGPVVI